MQTPLLKQKENDSKRQQRGFASSLERIVGAKINETEELEKSEELCLLKDGLGLIAILA